MADPEDLCFHTTYSLEADEVFGFEVEWTAHPISTWRRVVKITKIGRNCKFNKEEIRLKIDDIITDMNGREITSLDKFKRKVNERTTFRVLLQDDGDGGVVPPPVPIAIITDKPSNTARKRQRDEHQDNDTDTNKEHPSIPLLSLSRGSWIQRNMTTPLINRPPPPLYKDLASVVPTIGSRPFCYIGITLQRDPSSTQQSWGLVFVKEHSCLAFIVGINRDIHHHPSIMTTWRRSTRQIPPPLLVYRQQQQNDNSSNSNDDYEQFLIRNFPVDDNDDESSKLFSSPSIQPGDAILSINGIPMSSFPSIQLLACHIRQCCQRKMTLIIMRHEFVWNATAVASSVPSSERVDSRIEMAPSAAAAAPTLENNTNYVANIVKSSWMLVNNQHNNNNNNNFVRIPLVPKRTAPTPTTVPNKKKRKKIETNHNNHHDDDDEIFDNRQLYNPMFFQDPSNNNNNVSGVSANNNNNNPILYSDNDEFEPDDGNGKRIRMFLNDEMEIDFNGWLRKRKAAWREKWMVSIRTSLSSSLSAARRRRRRSDVNEEPSTTTSSSSSGSTVVVAHDFWLSNGYTSFDQWLSISKTKWRRSYSWHVDRRNQLEVEWEKRVHLPPLYSMMMDEQFRDWLIVRKHQWRIARRKRQRKQHQQKQQQQQNAVIDVATVSSSSGGGSSANSIVEGRSSSNSSTTATKSVEASLLLSTTTVKNTTNNNDTMYIDEMLEIQECNQIIEEKQQQQRQQPMDISWMFDSDLGAPDDVVLVIMKYLHPFEHGNLLCLSYTSNHLFKQRNNMWKTLCPKHWTLPRRPRKSWCVLYISKIRAEEEESRKRSDDLLVKANRIIEKGDLLNKFEKLVKTAEKDFRFDVNYTSGVVLERNSLLNMAIIDKRTKIAKWLMEVKGADIETWDRGQFTPLLNAAWNGDKHMVRYLLARGADRTKSGLNHSSKGLAPAGFNGLNAEEWARQRGHDDVAELIHIGI